MGLSTHILDTALGRPVPGVAVALLLQEGDAWITVGRGVTDADGRCRSLLGTEPLLAAVYKLRFETAPWFAAQGLASLFPFVEIAFQPSAPATHHHIPLLLTANGYTTYRGS